VSCSVLQELVSRKDQAQLRVDAAKFEPQLEFVHAAAFAAAFKRSETFQHTRAILDHAFEPEGGHPASLMRSRFGVPAWEHINALFWRERLLLGRNREAQKYRYIQMAVLAIMASTLFLRGEVTNTDSVRVRCRPVHAGRAHMHVCGSCHAAGPCLHLHPAHGASTLTRLCLHQADVCAVVVVHLPASSRRLLCPGCAYRLPSRRL
jgi:hypothetical protein